jgi:hypothetical protein
MDKTMRAEMTAEMATRRGFWEVGLGLEDWGRIREEMLAGKDANVVGEGGGGGEG